MDWLRAANEWVEETFRAMGLYSRLQEAKEEHFADLRELGVVDEDVADGGDDDHVSSLDGDIIFDDSNDAEDDDDDDDDEATSAEHGLPFRDNVAPYLMEGSSANNDDGSNAGAAPPLGSCLFLLESEVVNVESADVEQGHTDIGTGASHVDGGHPYQQQAELSAHPQHEGNGTVGDPLGDTNTEYTIAEGAVAGEDDDGDEDDAIALMDNLDLGFQNTEEVDANIPLATMQHHHAPTPPDPAQPLPSHNSHA